jgi:hypothetical protein
MSPLEKILCLARPFQTGILTCFAIIQKPNYTSSRMKMQTNFAAVKGWNGKKYRLFQTSHHFSETDIPKPIENTRQCDAVVRLPLYCAGGTLYQDRNKKQETATGNEVRSRSGRTE